MNKIALVISLNTHLFTTASNELLFRQWGKPPRSTTHSITRRLFATSYYQNRMSFRRWLSLLTVNDEQFGSFGRSKRLMNIERAYQKKRITTGKSSRLCCSFEKEKQEHRRLHHYCFKTTPLAQVHLGGCFYGFVCMLRLAQEGNVFIVA